MAEISIIPVYNKVISVKANPITMPRKVMNKWKQVTKPSELDGNDGCEQLIHSRIMMI